MSQPRKHTVVLGLDGLPRTLAQSLAASGRLPNLARLLALGAASIAAELPALSPGNWTSFLTAANPGRPAVYGFVGIDSATRILMCLGGKSNCAICRTSSPVSTSSCRCCVMPLR